jgi:hypothetical protein
MSEFAAEARRRTGVDNERQSSRKRRRRQARRADTGQTEAARLVLGLKERPDARRLEEIDERGRPIGGIAARMLWAYYRAAWRRAGMALESV